MSFEVVVVLMFVFAVSALATYGLTRTGLRRWLLDHPNERSLHREPTPRSGGLAIMLGSVLGGTAVGILTSAFGELLWIGGGAAMIATVSFLDDISHVNKSIRLGVHLLAALSLVIGGFAIHVIALPGVQLSVAFWLALPVTCLYTVWLTNVYNFMDGMDGFAGGMAVFGFGTFAVLGGLAEQPAFAGASGVIAAATGGYLLFNFPPARIFMGDVGSSLLGYLAAAMSLWASIDGIFPLWIAVLVFSPFIVDATFTLARRLWRREHIWESHKSHCYQRLVELGWGHRKTVSWGYAVMALCSLSAVLGAGLPSRYQWGMLVALVFLYVILIALIYCLESRSRSREIVEPL